MSLRRNVLVFHLGALGDFLLSLPLSMALGRLHPQSRVFVVTHRQKGLLAERLVGVESADVEAGWHHLFGDPSQLPEAAVRLLRGAHAIYSFIANEGDGWTAAARAVSGGADVCCLRPTPPAEHGGHATEFHVGQLAVASRPAAAEALRQMLRSVGERGLGGATSAAGPVLIHPGAGSAAKCWPAERYMELAGRLAAQGRPVRVALGEVELERWPAERVRRFRDAAPVVEPATILDLHAALTSAATFVGNDSGPGHLAGMMGVRTRVLFGATDPAVWRPLGPRVEMLRRQPLDALTVEEVLEGL